MKSEIILTIGRQFGSGGRSIGQQLARDLHFAYYDKELLAEAAKTSGLCNEVFEHADERTRGAAYTLPVGFANADYYAPASHILSDEQLFLFQSNAIQCIAGKGESCVLVGRCADYVLRDHPNLLSFFIHDKAETRIQTIAQRDHMSTDAAKEMMRKQDKSRAAYYKYYTGKEWGVASSYHFSINVSLLGIQGTVELIEQIVRAQPILP
ncbi:cytidylate kinase [Bacteroidia bacterium]|nr:cytidylate kinase [Bacteroidia bacterium]GHT80270.1 cytidylate kinase [Bacteroidia bacterium]